MFMGRGGLHSRDGSVVLHLAHLLGPPFGDVAVHGVEQLEQAALVELHEGDRGDGLRHGEDAEDGVVRHRCLALPVHEPERALVGEVPTAHHRDLAADDLPGMDVPGAEVLGDPLQALRVHAGRIGLDLHASSPQAFWLCFCFCSRM